MTAAEKRSRRGGRIGQISRGLDGFLGDQAGASFIITALTFPVLMGLAGLGLDAATWYADKRLNQTIADAGAVAGTIALSRDAGLSQSDLEAIVWTSTADNGFVHGTDGTVIVNSPPTAGANAGSAGFVEVSVRKQGALYFSGMVLDAAVNIETRAVGGISTFGNHCVVALDPSADGAIHMWGTADVNLSCGIASNSSSEKSIQIEGNASLTADPAQAYGDIYVGSNATLTTKSPPQPLSERVSDPYGPAGLNLQVPPPSACDEPSRLTLMTDTVLEPGRYCGGLWLKSGIMTFNPGVYIIDGGDFTTNGGATLIGDGVTIILTADDPADIGAVRMNGGTSVQLYAPATGGHVSGPYAGQYEGILFFVDPAAPSFGSGGQMISHDVQGGTDADFRGAIYAPSQEISYGGGADVGPRCVQVIARTISFRGNANLDSSLAACDAQGVASMDQTRVRLFE
jgi:Flp pilus assembly protein TadG